MRKLYLSVIAVLACLASFAANITATTNGSWTAPATWTINGASAGRTPQNGDVITIQQGTIITLNNGLTTPLSNVQLHVYGSLSMSVNNTILSLTASSLTVYSSTSATIERQNSNQDLTVGGATIFPATNTKIINAPYSTGTYVALPVKFSGFSVTRQNSDVLVQWSTAEEANAFSFEVERSTDGTTWSRITTVAAKGNSSSLTHYTYSDRNITAAVAYYRIRQVDIDGKSLYTSIQSVKSAAAAAEVKVAAINNRVVLQFANPVKGAVEIRLVTLAGQVVSKQVLQQPVGQVILNTGSAKGAYIISVSNTQDINVAKQVVL